MQPISSYNTTAGWKKDLEQTVNDCNQFFDKLSYYSHFNHNHKIIQTNLQLMFSVKEDGMDYLLGRESMGSNAGTFEDSPCSCANFYYNNQTGEIIYFGNYASTPLSILNYYQSGYFRVVNTQNTQKSKIIKYHVRNPSPLALTIIKKTVTQFNLQSFKEQ